MTRCIFLVPVILGLAGCSGGTGGTEVPARDAPLPIVFDSFAGGGAIETEIEASTQALGLMNPDDLLTTGTAQYEGTARISSTAGLNAIGVASLTADFDAPRSISGEAVDFVDDNDDAIDGTLRITNGSFDRDGAAGGDVSVDVSGDFGSSTFVVLQSDLGGAFFGDAEGIIIEGAAAGLVGQEATTYDILIVARSAE